MNLGKAICERSLVRQKVSARPSRMISLLMSEPKVKRKVCDLTTGLHPSSVAKKLMNSSKIFLKYMRKRCWLESASGMKSLLCSAKLISPKLALMGKMKRTPSRNITLAQMGSSSMETLQGMGSFMYALLSLSSRDTLTRFDCTTFCIWMPLNWKRTETSMRQSRSRGEQRQEEPFWDLIYQSLPRLGLILRQRALQGTEAPVLETQQMMRIVLVIGSEGISFTLGYFIIVFIFINYTDSNRTSIFNIETIVDSLENQLKIDLYLFDWVLTLIIQSMKVNEEIAVMNLRVLQRDVNLRNTEKILRTLKFVVMARYDEQGRHWNYLKVRGPLFLLVDRFGKHRLAIMSHADVENEVIMLHPGMRTEFCRIGNGQGCMLNYMIEDSLNKRSIFGIWSADEQLEALHKDICSMVL